MVAVANISGFSRPSALATSMRAATVRVSLSSEAPIWPTRPAKTSFG